MNISELNCRIEVLTLEKLDNTFYWKVSFPIWAKHESLDKTNLFSKVGIGVNSAKFTIRKRAMTLHHAFRWQGRHYYLTDIKEVNRMFYEVTAAQIEPVTCIATRKKPGKNELNRPTPGEPQTIAVFPACLVEKYLGYQQQKPQAVNEITYVLVTPKAIGLKSADLVKIGDDTFNVQIVHSLDEYKNEYEINLTKDVG